MKTILMMAAAAVALMGLSACDAPVSSASAKADSGSSSTGGVTKATWSNHDYTDDMRGTTTHVSNVDSVDEFRDDIGVRDPEHTTLEVQRRPKQTSVSISNPNLQFTCSAYTDSVVRVKFDNGPVERYGCTEEKTDKYGVAFILGESRFLAHLRKAKSVTIGAEVFQRGEVQMHWDLPETFDLGGGSVQTASAKPHHHRNATEQAEADQDAAAAAAAEAARQNPASTE